MLSLQLGLPLGKKGWTGGELSPCLSCHVLSQDWGLGLTTERWVGVRFREYRDGEADGDGSKLCRPVFVSPSLSSIISLMFSICQLSTCLPLTARPGRPAHRENIVHQHTTVSHNTSSTDHSIATCETGMMVRVSGCDGLTCVVRPSRVLCTALTVSCCGLQ